MRGRENKDCIERKKAMTYTLVTVNDWIHPYFYSENCNDKRLHREREVYTQYTVYPDMLLKMVKDWLDAPEKPMDDDAVRKEFDSDKRKIEDRFVQQIKKYYNARFEMFKEFSEFFEKNKDVPDAKFRKDIPYELNHYETEDNDNSFSNCETQNEAYFEVTIAAGSALT